MKKFILTLVALFTLTVTSVSAMSYDQARQQALFLTDKMAYELNLTDDQYEAAYEVNLDYLMGIDNYDDLYGNYWRQRNIDLSYILLDWQYTAFMNAAYFYRPLYWDGGYWHFRIYARYPRRDYFFFGRPSFYAVYRGGHCWRMNGGRSWYHGRTFGAPRPNGAVRVGMRDGFNRGDYGRGRTFGNMTRQSSTRTTVTQDRSFGNGRRPGNPFGNNSSTTTRPNNSFGNSSRPNNSFGNSNRPNSTFGNGTTNRPNNTFGGSSRPSSSFGGNRGGSSTGSFTPHTTPSTPSRSFGGSMSRGGGSFGGSSSTRSSGGSFGGHR